MRRQVSGTYDEVLARLPELLKAEGFGVLTRIDVKATLKEKLGVDFRRYRILGACNPKLAHQALTHEIGLGVMLPCNVAVWEDDAGKVMVSGGRSAADNRVPGSEARGPSPPQVRERLSRVLAQLG